MNERERQIEQVILEFRECGRQLSFDNIEHLAQLIAALPIVCDEMVWEEDGETTTCKVDKYRKYCVGTHPYPDDNGNATWCAWLITTDDDGSTAIEHIGGMNFVDEPEAKAACQAHLDETVNAMVKGGGK